MYVVFNCENRAKTSKVNDYRRAIKREERREKSGRSGRLVSTWLPKYLKLKVSGVAADVAIKTALIKYIFTSRDRCFTAILCVL